MFQFSIFGIQLDALEVEGAVIGLAYLFFEYRASIWTWVFGVLMPIVYVYLFFRNGLYANMSINIYYIVASVYGFVMWRRASSRQSDAGGQQSDETIIESCPRRYWLAILLVLALLTAALYLVLTLLHESQYPLLDALSTALSIVMMYMLSRRWYQQWLLCIATEPIMIALGVMTGMYATAVMYSVYMVVAVMGYFKWRRKYNIQALNQ
ncbi:MAG: nicotinamide riboside transporter PnuC [Bacteroidales bacterium]|nr:nicotinamide riboside transporter PnuC [Bacteroidales bacterium]